MFIACNILAIIGFYVFYTYIMKESPAFFGLSFISFSTVIIYFFGCFEALNIGCVFVILLGVVLLVLTVLRGIRAKICVDKRIALDPAVFFLLLGGVWSWFLSRDIFPAHYDDLSHWLRICKIMHADGSYPYTLDCFFPYYLPGTATWIYYATRSTGYSPQNCYFAQMLINVACCSCFFGILRNESDKIKKTVLFCIIGIVSVYLCAMNVTTFALVVDGTLGLVAAALVIMIMTHKNEGNMTIRYLVIMSIAVFTVLIKNSGIILVLFAAIAMLFCEDRSETTAKKMIAKWGQVTALVIIPWLCTSIYTIRAKKIYGAIWNQGTLDAYLSIFDNGDVQRYIGVIEKFLEEVFIIHNARAQIKLIWISFLVIGALLVRNKIKKVADSEMRFLGWYLPLMSFIWGMGVLVTFFTLDVRSANRTILLSFERYMGTITIFVVGLVMYKLIGMVTGLTDLKLFGKRAGITVLILAMICQILGVDAAYIFGNVLYKDKMLSSEAWEKLIACSEERWDYNTDGYVIVTNVEEKDFQNYYNLHQLITTYFRSFNCTACDVKDLEQAGITEDELQIDYPNLIRFY